MAGCLFSVIFSILDVCHIVDFSIYEIFFSTFFPQAREATDAELPYSTAKLSDVRKFSQSFIDWVMHGEAFCNWKCTYLPCYYSQLHGFKGRKVEEKSLGYMGYARKRERSLRSMNYEGRTGMREAWEASKLRRFSCVRDIRSASTSACCLCIAHISYSFRALLCSQINL